MQPPGRAATFEGKAVRVIGFAGSPGKKLYLAASGDARPVALVDGKERLGFDYGAPVRIEAPRGAVEPRG
ncbi:hypothetical protein [Actinomadura macra]|uniref:hypothetical protein n=1 Tax=Actinomadura macra TaxID=46164 RepID=UPI0008374687|nr:hypothetical protein [Actinomadura macra]